jgi:hypothetical protein
MKIKTNKKVLLCLAAVMTLVLAAGGAAYAAWLNYGKNQNNTVKLGDAVVITLDKADGTKYFDGVALADQGAETTPTKITVTAVGNAATTSYQLKITNFSLSGAAFTNTSADLYVKVIAADAEPSAQDWSAATPAAFGNGATLLDAGTGTRSVWIVIGLGDAADIALAGRTATFAIGVV